ncbi:hypothetical protein BVX95_00950 [archaeon D22]|nr:hypothetical protein BVX95_00950 [archaeon D22]
MEKLKSKINEAIELIKKSAEKKQVIFLRHHNDCDGYTSAVALDSVISKIVSDNHFRDRDAFYYYRRIPSQTPFYAYEDATRDISYIYEGAVSRNKEPLMVIVDTGSSNQSLDSYKKLKAFGFKIIVIDHHPYSKEVEGVVDVLVNPHTISSDILISAGALSCNIAKGMQNGIDYDFISCVADISDHTEGENFASMFHNIADKYDYENLRLVGDVVDYELQRNGYNDPWTIVKEILTDERGLRDQLIDNTKGTLAEIDAQTLLVAKHYSKADKVGQKIIVSVDMASITSRGSYPSMSRTVSMLHRNYEAENADTEIITYGVSPEMITFRATDNSTFDTNNLIAKVKEKIPHGKIEGGGHAHAGSVRFIPAAFGEVLDFVNTYLR